MSNGSKVVNLKPEQQMDVVLILTVDKFGKSNLQSSLPPEEVVKYLDNVKTGILFNSFQKSNIVKPQIQ